MLDRIDAIVVPATDLDAQAYVLLAIEQAGLRRQPLNERVAA